MADSGTVLEKRKRVKALCLGVGGLKVGAEGDGSDMDDKVPISIQ